MVKKGKEDRILCIRETLFKTFGMGVLFKRRLRDSVKMVKWKKRIGVRLIWWFGHFGSTISNYHGVVLVINKEPDIVLNWKKLTAQQWETTFLATYYDLRRTGGLHSDGSFGSPFTSRKDEAIQRPAQCQELKE